MIILTAILLLCFVLFLVISTGLFLVAGLGNSADPVRVCANGLPVYILFQIQVFQTLYNQIKSSS